jgi:F-type H+-transporting ATPase subunit epsilon
MDTTTARRGPGQLALRVFDDLAYMVIAPSVLGEVGILPRHTPFIAFLRTGETRIKLLDDIELVYATTEG